MTVNITLTFPEKVIKRIDKDRDNINRSKYVVKLIKEAYNHQSYCPDKEKLLQQLDSRSGQLIREKSVATVVKTESTTNPGSGDSSHED